MKRGPGLQKGVIIYIASFPGCIDGSISYIDDPIFAIDYLFFILLHCGIEKGPNFVVFQSHNASEKNNQWQKLDHQYSL